MRNNMYELFSLIIMFRGAGDLASGAALRLYGAGLRRMVFLENTQPLAVRRTVSFSEAIYDGSCTVEGVSAIRLELNSGLQASCQQVWQQDALPVLADPDGQSVHLLQPDVLIEATLTKDNIGVKRSDAPLVIGVGPGFCAGGDVHRVVESQRGLSMGRLIRLGSALPNTGQPESVLGHSSERVLRAPCAGIFATMQNIGACVCKGETIATVNDQAVTAAFDGRIRGLLRPGIRVTAGTKLGDIDPRLDAPVNQVSDKGLSIGGALLEAILEHFLIDKETICPRP